jgi:hypothetical protein
MSAPQKYSPEVRDRAVRLVDDLLADDQLQLSVTGAWRRVGEQLGINRDTLRIVSRPFGPLRGRLALGSIDPSAKLSAYRLASPSKSWLMARAPRVITGRNSFRYTRSMTLVLPWPTKCAISSMVIPELESKDTKLCRNSRGVNSLGQAQRARDQAEGTPDVGGVECRPLPLQKTRPSSTQESPAWRRIFSCSAL